MPVRQLARASRSFGTASRTSSRTLRPKTTFAPFTRGGTRLRRGESLESEVDRWIAATDAETRHAGGRPPRRRGSADRGARRTDARPQVECTERIRGGGSAQAVAALLPRLDRGLTDSDGHEVCVAAHLMQRSFAAYRVAKYRWLEDAVEDGRFTPVSAYYWME